MRFSLKDFFAGSLAFLLSATASFANLSETFESHVKSGDAAAIEKMVQKLDEENVASGNKKEANLFYVLNKFRTTKLDIRDVLAKWETTVPESIYFKTAKAFHLDHLSWIVRGNETTRFTYHKAMDQMHQMNTDSNELIWGVFYQRNDFTPASEFIAQSYARSRGEMPLIEFADLALKATPTPDLLDNIVYSVNPKWGGSWEQIEYYCDTYADKVVTEKWYTSEGCKATAIFQMSSTLHGGNTAQVEWARSILEKAPLSALRSARHTDMFYLRRETLNPDNKDLAVSLFHPANRNAVSFAQKIESRAGVEGFYAEQLPKIEAAKRRRALRDPYNPANMEGMKQIIYAKYPHETITSSYGESIVLQSSRPAMQEYAAYLQEVAKVAPYRSDVWREMASFQLMTPGGQTLMERNRINRERSVLYSNYNPQLAFSYFRDLYIADMNVRPKFPNSSKSMAVQISTDDEAPVSIEIDKVALSKALECPMVRMARITDLLCSEGASSNRQCRNPVDLKLVKETLLKAMEKSYCPSLLNLSLIHI